MNRGLEGATVWKIPACAIAYPAGVMISGIAFRLLGFPLPASPIPHATGPQHPMLLLLAASLLLAVGTAPLAYGLRGSYASRAVVLAIFVYVCVSLNNIIEATRFMAAYARGGALNLAVFQALPCVLFALAAALWLGSNIKSSSFMASLEDFFSLRGLLSCSWRIILAVLCFPAIYFVFGMSVAPIVVPYYRDSRFGLTIPSSATVLSTAAGRSVLYLLATLPVLILWNGTRRRLAVVLGLALTVMVGWFGLLQASFLPTVLRVVHSVEICADSFVYALALVLLLTGRRGVAVSQSSNGLLSELSPDRSRQNKVPRS
jgi:hypothetical protein